MADDSYTNETWDNPYAPSATGLINDTPDTSTEPSTNSPFGTASMGQQQDYTQVANELGLSFIDSLTSSLGNSALSSLSTPLANMGDASGAASDGIDWRGIVKQVSGDTWAKLLGGAVAGAGSAYIKGKELGILQQNADTQRQTADLAKAKDQRAASSARDLKWKMGLINQAQGKSQPVTFTPAKTV